MMLRPVPVVFRKISVSNGSFPAWFITKSLPSEYVPICMADYGKLSAPETLIPPITQEALADMIGSTRSRISFFMNRFRALGYIEYKGYNGRIRVHTSLLNVVLHDQLPEDNAMRPKLLDPILTEARISKRSKIC